MLEFLKNKTFISYFLYPLGRKCIGQALVKTLETTIFTLFPILENFGCLG